MRSAGNVYAYVSNCWGPSGHAHSHELTGVRNAFRDNKCIANSDTGGFASDCVKPANLTVSGNIIYNREGRLANIRLCDATNVVKRVPSDEDVIAMGLKVIE